VRRTPTIFSRPSRQTTMRLYGLSARRLRISVFALVQVEQVDVLAMGHDGADTLLVEAQHIGDDGLLAGVEDPAFGTLAHQHLDLVVGDRRLLRVARSKQAQQQVGRRREQPYQGARQSREQVHRWRNQRSDTLRCQQAETFGYQFADHDREIGQHGDDQRQWRCAGVVCERLEHAQPFGQWNGQRRLADGAAEDADRGDADLDGGKKNRGLVTAAPAPSARPRYRRQPASAGVTAAKRRQRFPTSPGRR
jgi:hypothetical protein